MKKFIPYIVIAILVLTQILLFSEMHILKNNLATMENQIWNLDNNLNNQIASIYSNVDEKLEEQASIIHMASLELGAFDTETLTVPITFTVVPKVVTEDLTVSLAFDDETILLTKDDTTYFGTKIFTVTGHEISPTIILESQGSKSITQDDGLRVYSLVDEYIPRLYPMTPFYETTVNAQADGVEYLQYGEMFFDGGSTNFASANFVTCIDDVKVSEIQIDLVAVQQEPVITLPEKTYELKNGQVLTTYVIAVDNLGLTHTYPQQHYVAGNEAQREPYYNAVKITTQNGEVVYDNTADY